MTICFPKLLLQCSLPPVGYKDSQLPLTFVNTCYFQMSCVFAHFVDCVLSFLFCVLLFTCFVLWAWSFNKAACRFYLSLVLLLRYSAEAQAHEWLDRVSFLFVHRQCGIETKQTDFTLETGDAELTTFLCTENPALRLKREKCLKETLEQKDYKWRKR